MRLESIMQGLQHLLLRSRSQINEDIAATDQVQSREWRIVGHILSRKDTAFAYGFVDLVPLPAPLQRKKKSL
jgi:hypothetical protein